MEGYTGIYKFSESKTAVSISIEENKLVFQVMGQTNKFALFPESENLFFMKEAPNKVEFKLDEVGNIIDLTLIRSNRTIEAEKIK